MRYRFAEFDPLIYPRKIWVAINVPTERLNKTLDGIEDMDKCSDATTITTGRTIPDKKGGILIRFNRMEDVTASTVTHESIHAALFVFEYIDAVVNAENQEPFAYLAGWIADCIWQVKTGQVEDWL